MSTTPLRLLVIDDDADDVLLLRNLLARDPLTAHYAVDHAPTAGQGLDRLQQGRYDVGLVDFRLGAADGVSVLAAARGRDLPTPLILLTGAGDEQVAVDAMKAGAVDYLPKARLTADSLAAAVRYAASLGESRRQLRDSGRRFQRVFDQAMVGNIITTPEGRILACNRALAIMLGYAAVDELLAVNAYDLYADRATRDAYLEQLRRNGCVEDFAGELLRRDGVAVHVLIHGTAVKDAAGGLMETHASVLDVTARRQAEQQVRDSEERYRRLFDGNPQAILVADEETMQLVAVNDAAVREYGYSREQFLTLTLLDLRPPEDATSFVEQFRATSNSSARFQSRHLRADGTVFDVEVEGHAVSFNRRAARLGVVTDVTERRRAEKALRASEERFRALVENSSDGIVIVGGDDVVRFCSPATTRLLGWPRDEAVGMRAFHLVHPQDRQLLLGSVAEAVALGGQPVTATVRIRCRDGSYRLLETAIADRSGEPSVDGLVFNFRDVTDRRRAEEELRLRDRAIEHISQALVIIDALDPDRPIVHANRSFERITGYPVAQAVGRNARFLGGPDTDAAAVEALSQAISDGAPAALDVVLHRADGRPVCCNVAITPVAGPDGRITHFVALGSDITESRRLEEQYRQAQKMEAVGRLAGGIAHDFNNLIAVILGYAEMVQRRADVAGPVRHKMEEISKAAHRAAALTRQLLAFGRKQVLSPTPLDLGGVVGEIAPMLRRLIGEDVSLTVQVPPELGVVKADRGQMEQVVVNLAVNARDAMPRGGSLLIACRDVRLAAALPAATGAVPPGDYVELSVTDSGTGMDAETLRRVFEPFFTTKGTGKGTGLGLATAHGIVEQSGGHITVRSAPGQGACFTIYLPRIDATVEPPVVAPPAEVPRGRETILLVEDEDALRELAAEVLADLGYNVLEAKDGPAALDVAESGAAIDAVVTDVIMPSMSGRELVARLGARSRGRVLYMSGYSEDAISQHGVLDEGTAFMQKPFSPERFARAVRDLLDGRVAS